MVKDPTDNVSACEDFFLHVVEMHILSACMTVFGMTSVHDTPYNGLFPEASVELDSLKRRQVLMLAIQEVMERYV